MTYSSPAVEKKRRHSSDSRAVETFTVDDDVSIDGSTATLTLTEIVNAFNVNLAVSDEIRIGTGQLNIRSGSQVSNIARGVIGNVGGNFGTATVTGTGSTWTNSNDLIVGNFGIGTLNINDSGLVTVGTTTSINASSSVVLNGGRFEFGTIDLASYARISGTSGELAGDLPLSGFNALSTSVLSILNLDVSEVRILNSGVLFGTGVVGQALVNSPTSELRTLAGEWARFGGVSNTNAGEVNNFGGVVEFEQDFTNEATGFVGGRGQFIANGGWTNEGAMAFSGGFADVLGDVTSSATAQIVVGGGSVTTFFDDVSMESTSPSSTANIDVALGSTAVFLGSYNGGNDGAGTIEVLGDLRPGNSPAEVTFGGDLTLGTGANTFIELAGTTLGEFDRFDIAGDLSLDGDLVVSLLGNFELDMAMEFIVAKVDGALTGVFANFADGDLVGTFGGTNLYIDYESGDGNDVTLLTALPGDFDFDGDVDGSDFLTWQRNPSVGSLADWEANYGTVAPLLASASAVPEPSAGILLVLGMVTLLAGRRTVVKTQLCVRHVINRPFLAILITVVFTHSSFAAPLLSVSDLGISGLNRFWLVEVAPDPLLFVNGIEGFGSSLGVELAFEVTDGDVLGASKNGTDWPVDNPGNNPFTASVSFGVVVDLVGDTVFASLGSEFFTTDDPVEVLTIETTGTGLPALSWGGHVLLPGTIHEYTGSRIVQEITIFDGHQGSLTADSGPSADFDADGDVDGTDFLLWQRGFGTMGGALKGQGDANVDGNVDAADLAIWETEYGTSPLLLALNGVPEPATAILITLAALVMLGLRGHKANYQ